MSEGGVCGECRDQPRTFRAARSAGLYEGVLRTLILRFKYSPSRPLADPLAAVLHECMLRRRVLNPDKIDCLLPVPVHPQRLRERDYNQSAEMAIVVGRRMRIPVDTKSLRKTRETRPQMTLSARDRQSNLVGAFAVRDADAVRGKRILLIDDVMTTGATAQECAKTLLAAGAAEVRVLTLARDTKTLTTYYPLLHTMCEGFDAMGIN